MFTTGTTLNIQGVTYNWSYAEEDRTFHTDYYIDSNDNTVTAMGFFSGFTIQTLAIVCDESNTPIGYIENGVYGDNHQSFLGNGTWEVNGVTYTHREMLMDASFQKDEEGNFLQNEEGNLCLTKVGYDKYSYTGSPTSISGQSNISWLQKNFQFQDSSRSSTTSGNTYNDEWTENYTSNDGSTLQIIQTNNNGTVQYVVQIWGPEMGLVKSSPVNSLPTTSNLSSLTWLPRTAPTFAKEIVMVNGRLLMWYSGTVSSDGFFTDTYGEGMAHGIFMTIKAQADDYFTLGGDAAVWTDWAGQGTLGHDGIFHVDFGTVENAYPTRSVPFWTGSNTVLNVNGSNYTFIGGYYDREYKRVDFYGNPAYGNLAILGTAVIGSTSSDYGYVKIIRNGTGYWGTYNDGVFSVTDNTISLGSSQPTLDGLPAFWVRGEFYLQDATTPTSYASAAGHHLTFSYDEYGSWRLEGVDGIGDFTGDIGPDPLGIRIVQDAQGDTTVPVIAANADGLLHLSWQGPPTGMPPAVKKENAILVYLGVQSESSGGIYSEYAYYRSALGSDQNPWLLKLAITGSNTEPCAAICTNYITGVSTTGIYSKQTHFFQTSGADSGFPMLMSAVNPHTNYIAWEQFTPDSSTGLPATFLLDGDVWRYSGTDSNGTASYQGYYSNPTVGTQILTVSAADPDTHLRTVTVTDPFKGDGTPVHGTLSNERGSARLSDGSEVYSGNFAGDPLNPSLNDSGLFTISSDLDITGNVITFGALSDSAASAGATFHFQDVSNSGSLTASLSSILARPQSQWLWSHTIGNSAQETTTAMKLDATHNLTLYNSAEPSSATVKLSPDANTSSELPRLKLTNQTTLDEDGQNVLTQAIGDGRYLRSSGSGGSQNFALNGSLNIDTGTGGSSNSLPAEANAVVIGQNLNAGSGQVVVGRYNDAAATENVFIVGAGTSTSATKNALSVSTSGDTTVAGGLAVTGTTSLSNATVSGSLKVNNQDVLTKGQVLRVYPAGDLPMHADFKAVPSGVTAPTDPNAP